MRKIAHLFSFIVMLFLLSCDKKVIYPTIPVNMGKTDTNSGKIFTIAGNGYALGGYTGNGGKATSAEINQPYGVTVDAIGNIYISDCQNNVVRKVNTKGIISTFAGARYFGYSGDGGPATAAEFHYPYGLAVDGSNNLYIADNMNYRIRKVNAGGIISTIAGNGVSGFSGDGGPATAAELNLPYGLAIDVKGNIYLADYSNESIRKINTDSMISTVAGIQYSGYSGDGGPATLAELGLPTGVAIDNAGDIYIPEYANNRIRMVNTNGIISTIAGNGYGAPSDGAYYGDGGPATNAELYEPTDVLVDGSSNVYLYDASNYRIRVINANGIISTIVGIGDNGFSGDGGMATAAEIGFGEGFTIDASGNLYLADLYFNRVRIVYK